MKVVKGLELSAHWQGHALQERKTMLMENVNVMIG
jgi:hypothetical protein